VDGVGDGDHEGAGANGEVVRGGGRVRFTYGFAYHRGGIIMSWGDFVKRKRGIGRGLRETQREERIRGELSLRFWLNHRGHREHRVFFL
jgi:hypothetical protein